MSPLRLLPTLASKAKKEFNFDTNVEAKPVPVLRYPDASIAVRERTLLQRLETQGSTSLDGIGDRHDSLSQEEEQHKLEILAWKGPKSTYPRILDATIGAHVLFVDTWHPILESAILVLETSFELLSLQIGCGRLAMSIDFDARGPAWSGCD
jgi:hypothetical protein